MNNYVDIEFLPAVRAILDDAKKNIRAIVGSNIALHVKLIQKASPEENKAILKEIIEKDFDIPWHRIITKNRKPELVDARHLYMFFSKHFLRQSLTKTGMDLDLDHTSVVHGLQKMQDMIDTNDPITERIKRIKERLPYDN